MTVSLPLLCRFQSLVWGAVLGGSWGWQSCPNGERSVGDYLPRLFDLQDFWVQVCVDQSPDFLQLAQHTRLEILRVCAQTGKAVPSSLASVSRTTVPPPEAMAGLEPWIALLISTLLPSRSQPPSPSETMAALHLLWQQMLYTHVPLSISLSTVIPQWLTTLSQQRQETDLAQLLGMVETDFQQCYTARQFAGRLFNLEVEPELASIAIAWYCFRCTPQDLALSLTRVVQLSPRPHLAALLTGTWSSLYNGNVIFAAKAGTAHLIASLPPLPDSLIVSQAIVELLQSVTFLFATWAGISVSNEAILNPRTLLTITAPRQMLHV